MSDSPAATWGPVLTGTFLASIVYGISVLQTFFYYTHHGYDRMSWKVLVAAIFVLDTAALGLTMYCMQYYLVISWGNPTNLNNDVLAYPTEFVLTSVLAFLVQGFYINTIRALHAPIIVIVLLVSLAITALVTGLILPGVQVNLKYIDVIVPNYLNHLAFNLARGTALACDVIIVIALCWLLEERKTGVKRSNNMINTLMMFALQRGVLQAVIELGELLSYTIKPDGIYFLPFHVIISRIYCTSLLATLNSRGYVARRGGDSDAIQKHLAHQALAHPHRNVIEDENMDDLYIQRQHRLPIPPVTSHSTNTRAIFSTFISYFDPPFLSNMGEQSGGDDGACTEEGRGRLSQDNTQKAFSGFSQQGRCDGLEDIEALDLEAAFNAMHDAHASQSEKTPGRPWVYRQGSNSSLRPKTARSNHSDFNRQSIATIRDDAIEVIPVLREFDAVGVGATCEMGVGSTSDSVSGSEIDWKQMVEEGQRVDEADARGDEITQKNT